MYKLEFNYNIEANIIEYGQDNHFFDLGIELFLALTRNVDISFSTNRTVSLSVTGSCVIKLLVEHAYLNYFIITLSLF